MFKKMNKIDENFPKSSIEVISKEKNDEILAAYKNIDNPELRNQIRQETREMIPQIDERIHYWEDRRTLFLQISLGIVAASLAGLIAIAPEISSIFDNFFDISTLIYLPILLLCLVLLIGGVVLIYIWNKQNNPDYPFTKGTKTWRWQYRHAETTPNETECEKFDSKKMEKEAYIFANNLADYKIKLLTSKSQDLLDQDISQLYLLLIDEKFKIKFVTKLRNSLFSVLTSAICFFISSILCIGVASLVNQILSK